LWLSPLSVCAGLRTAALGSSELAASVVDSRVRSTRSRCAPLARLKPPVSGLAPSLAARARSHCWSFYVKPVGWVSRRSAAASARQLLPCPGSGTVFTRWVCDAGGRGSTGRLGDRPTIRGSRYASAFDTRHAGACRGDAVPERAAAATPASQRLPHVSSADISSSSLLG